MKITVNLLANEQLKASFGEHEIISEPAAAKIENLENIRDQDSQAIASYPEPFDYFLASMPLCAAFYMRRFCQERGISTEGLTVVQHNSNIDSQDKYKKKIVLEVTVPDDFPQKYRKALIKAANTCTVKKVIQAMPEFDISLV